MEINKLQKILEQFDKSSLTEFELHKADFELYLNKNTQPRQKFVNLPLNQINQSQEISAKSSTNENNNSKPAIQTETVSVATLEPETSTFSEETITAPIVGVVYLQSSPKTPPFVSVGKTVSSEQTVCIIEAMKMMNEIPAGINGEITEILVENEQVVGIGDELFKVKMT